MRKYLVEVYSELQINTKNKCRVLTGLRKSGIQGEEGAVFCDMLKNYDVEYTYNCNRQQT